MSKSINEFRAGPFGQAAPMRFLFSAGLSLFLLAGSTAVQAKEPLELKGEELAKGIHYVEQLAFTADSKILAIGWDKGIILLEVEKGKKLDTKFDGVEGSFHSLAFSPDGKLLVASNGRYTWVLDVATGKKKHTFEVDQSGEAGSIAISADGKTFAISGWAHSATLFDLETFKELAKLEGQKEIKTVAFDKKGEALATASQNGTVVIWDVKKREKKKTLDMSHVSDIGSMSYSADGKTVVTNGTFKGNSMLVVWDVEKGEPRRTYGGVKPKLGDIAVFSFPRLTPDGKSLVFSCGALLAIMPDIDSGDAPEAAPGFKPDSTIQAIAISPDGKLVAVGFGYHVKIVEVPEKKKKE